MLKRNHNKSTKRVANKKQERGSHLKRKRRSNNQFHVKRKIKIPFKAIIKLLLVVALIVVVYEVYNLKQDTQRTNDSLNSILEKLEQIETNQNTLTEKQVELEEKEKQLEISKAEKKAEEERIAKEKAEAEERAKQEAIKVAQAKQVTSRGGSSTRTTVTASSNEYQQYAHDLCINTYGWTENDFTCLVKLWNRESGWNPNAHNSSSGAHGIPQSLPASKMASEGDDYYTNGYTQIRWGLKYIAGRYGTPSAAWAHSESHNWY